MEDTATVRMYNGDWKKMHVCGRAPMHKGQSTIIIRHEDGNDCFAARLTPSGWEVLTEPVRLYPIT